MGGKQSMKTLLQKKYLYVVVAVLFVALALTTTAFATGGGGDKVDICHAHPPDTAANGWNPMNISGHAILQQGHDNHAADIIPPFDYIVGWEHKTLEWSWSWGWGWSDWKPGKCGWDWGWSDWKPGKCGWDWGCQDRPITNSYPGKNMDTEWEGHTGAEILAAGCVIPYETCDEVGDPVYGEWSEWEADLDEGIEFRTRTVTYYDAQDQQIVCNEGVDEETRPLPEPSGSIWREVLSGECVEGGREWSLNFEARNLQNIGDGSVYMNVIIDGNTRQYNEPGPHNDTWVLGGGSHSGDIELWYSPSGGGSDVLLDAMRGNFSVEDCYTVCDELGDPVTTYGEWSAWVEDDANQQFVRTRTYTTVTPDLRDPDHICDTTSGEETDTKSYENEQCGRCSNVFVGWVEWVDRNGGGCDDDWYNEREEFPYDERCYDECSEGNIVSEGKVYTNPHNVGEPEWGDWINDLNGKKFRKGKQYIASDWTETFVDAGTGAVCFVDEGTTEGVTKLYEEECASRWTGRWLYTYVRTVRGHWVTYCNPYVPFAADTNGDDRVSEKEATAWKWSDAYLAELCALDCEPPTWQGRLLTQKPFREFKDICGIAHEEGTLFGGNHYDDSCEIFDYCDWKESQEVG